MVARRFDAFGETIFTEMSRLAREHGAINLGQGFPNFDGPDFVKDAAIDAIRAGENQYAPMTGAGGLPDAIAARFRRVRGVSVEADHVTVTSGCTEAIASTMLGLVDPGDEVILLEPYYDSYRAAVAMAGATPVYVTLHAPTFTWDEDELRAAFARRPRAILVNTPHNPTGRVFSRAELDAIASLAKEYDVTVLSDEVYEELVFEGEHIAIASLPGMFERTVTMSSLGKTFSLTGWKIGWAIAPPDLTLGLRRAHQFITFSGATPLQHGAAAAIRAGDDYFDQLRVDYRARRDLLVDGLREIGFSVESPAGTYFVLADHTRFGDPDDVTFCRRLIEEVGVAAIPPSAFYQRSSEGSRLVRFAFCKDEQTLRDALERLAALRPAGASQRA